METIPTFIIEHGQCEYCEFDIQDTSQVLKRLIITLYHYVKSIFINSCFKVSHGILLDTGETSL
jgi:hypothetical protein